MGRLRSLREGFADGARRELKDENYGTELLNAIGKAYDAKAAQHLASSQFAPLGWFHGAKTTFNTMSDTYVVSPSQQR